MENVKIVDYYAVGKFHEVVNYSFLKLFSSIYKQVKYVSGKSANQNIKRMLTQEDEHSSVNIDCCIMPIYEQDTRRGAHLRDLWGFFLTLYQYFITPYRTLIFYNYTNKFSLPLILLFNILLRKKIVFVFHGELEFLIGKVSFLKLSGWYKKSMQFSFHYLFDKSPSYPLVLGDSIKSNLLKIYPKLESRILSIYHPCYFDDAVNYKIDKSHYPIKIGTVGSLNNAKGLNTLIELSIRLQDVIRENLLEIYSIGKVNDKDVELVDTIRWIGSEKGLPRNEFEQYIKQLSYILYLYPTDSYKFTASGALMDAVKMGKPIIALHNDYFNHMLSNNPIGYLGDSIDDIEYLIRQIISGSLKDDFSDGFKLLRNKVSIDNNIVLLKKELERVRLY